MEVAHSSRTNVENARDRARNEVRDTEERTKTSVGGDNSVAERKEKIAVNFFSSQQSPPIDKVACWLGSVSGDGEIVFLIRRPGAGVTRALNIPKRVTRGTAAEWCERVEIIGDPLGRGSRDAPNTWRHNNNISLGIMADVVATF